MFAASGDTINLENLPWDIVGKIIKIGIESIDNMKLISPRWKVLAGELLEARKYRKYFPKINEFIWGCFTTNQRTVKVRIPIKYRDYFGFKECHRPHIPENSRSQLYSRVLHHSCLKFVPDLVERCSTIDCAQIYLSLEGPQEIRALSALLLNVSIVEVTFDEINALNKDYQKRILSFIRAHKVKRLCLTTGYSNVFEANLLALLEPAHLIFFTRVLDTAMSVEFAIKSAKPSHTWLMSRYAEIAADLRAKQAAINLGAFTEDTEDDEMRLRVKVTRREN